MEEIIFNYEKFQEQGRNCLKELELREDILNIQKNKMLSFDYSAESVELIMVVINSFKNSYLNKSISFEVLNKYLFGLGWYLGETILKNGLSSKGGKWCASQTIPGFEGKTVTFLQDSKGMMHFPIFKIQKYLANGEVDDLKQFFNSCINM